MKLTEEDKIVVERLLTLSTASGTDVQVMQRIISTYIDPHCHICSHCSSQIRFGMNRIKMWYAKYKEQ